MTSERPTVPVHTKIEEVPLQTSFQLNKDPARVEELRAKLAQYEAQLAKEEDSREKHRLTYRIAILQTLLTEGSASRKAVWDKIHPTGIQTSTKKEAFAEAWAIVGTYNHPDYSATNRGLLQKGAGLTPAKGQGGEEKK